MSRPEFLDTLVDAIPSLLRRGAQTGGSCLLSAGKPRDTAVDAQGRGNDASVNTLVTIISEVVSTPAAGAEWLTIARVSFGAGRSADWVDVDIGNGARLTLPSSGFRVDAQLVDLTNGAHPPPDVRVTATQAIGTAANGDASTNTLTSVSIALAPAAIATFNVPRYAANFCFIGVEPAGNFSTALRQNAGGLQWSGVGSGFAQFFVPSWARELAVKNDAGAACDVSVIFPLRV